MGLFFDWLKSRWRTRGEYGIRLRGLASRWLVPLGVRLAGMLVVVALILAALWWVLGAPSRAGARAMRIDALRDTIVRAVTAAGPGTRGTLGSLEELVTAGILTTDDAGFLNDQGIVYHPITRGSPDTAIVLLQTRGGVERRYRKNGSEDYYEASTSPDGRLSVVIGPGRPRAGTPPRRTRSVTVRALDTGREVGSLEVPEWARAHWSPDGRFLALETRPDDPSRLASTVTLVLDVGSGYLERLDLPDAVRPESLLAPEDRAARLQEASVRFARWRGSTLVVESGGFGWIGPPGEAGSTSLTIRVRFALDVSADGIRETSREVVTYARR